MDKKNLEEFVNKVEENANFALEDTLLDEDAKEENQNIDYNDIVKNDTQAKMSKLPWLTAIILIFVIALATVATFFKSNPQAIFTMAIDKFFKGLTENFSDTNYEILKGNIEADFKVSGYEDLNGLDNYSFDIDYFVDNVNNLSYSKVETKYENKDLIDFELYNNKKNVYVYFEDLFDSYLQLKDVKIIKPVSSKNTKLILTGLNQAFDKVVTNEKITTTKTTLDIDNKSVKTYEAKLIVDKNNKDRVAETFINTLKSNDELITALAQTSNKTENDVKILLDNYLNRLKVFFEKNEKLEIELYADKKNVDFIKGKINGKLGTFTVTKKNETYDFTLINNKTKDNVSGDITLETGKSKYNLELNVKTTNNGNLVRQLNTNVNATVKKASIFKKIDVSKAINIDELTDEQKLDIYSKLLAKLGKNQIANLIK